MAVSGLPCVSGTSEIALPGPLLEASEKTCSSSVAPASAVEDGDSESDSAAGTLVPDLSQLRRAARERVGPAFLENIVRGQSVIFLKLQNIGDFAGELGVSQFNLEGLWMSSYVQLVTVSLNSLYKSSHVNWRRLPSEEVLIYEPGESGTQSKMKQDDKAARSLGLLHSVSCALGACICIGECWPCCTSSCLRASHETHCNWKLRCVCLWGGGNLVSDFPTGTNNHLQTTI